MWPLIAMFGLVPLWWLLGGFYPGWPVFGALLLGLLVARGRVAVLPGTLCWLLFIALVLLSATRIDRGTAYLTFGLKVGFLLTALVVAVYVYNLGREGIGIGDLLRPVALFWLGLVALGWLGVLYPTFSMVTALEAVLPGNLAADRFVQDLVHAQANEFNAGSARPIYRTAAPYAHTNNWGTAYALLLPCVLAYVTAARRGALRTAVLVSLPLSVVPAFFTLNRGMFLGLGAGLLYLAVRSLIRGRGRLFGGIVAVGVLFYAVSLVVPVWELINARVETTDTNVDRLDLYVRTWEAVLQSPLLGHGVPNMVDTSLAAEPLGTQGMLWHVMYSYGIPALLTFLCWLVLAAWRLRRGTSPAAQWLSVVPVIALVVIPVYGYLDPNLSILFLAVGAGLATLPAAPLRAAPVRVDPVRVDPVRADPVRVAG
jgi:hypothetical protein